MVREETKKAVLLQVIKVIEDAQKQGRDGWAAAEKAFPGMPISVIAEADNVVAAAATDAWWRTVEQTIDGEIVKRALEAPGGKS